MRYLPLFTVVGVLAGELVAQETKIERASPAITAAAALRSGELASKLAPRYSPPGHQFKLTPYAAGGLPGVDHLQARVQVGPGVKRGEGHLIVIARSATGKPYTMLWFDRNRTGKLEEKPVTTASKIIREKHWSTFDAKLGVNHRKAGEAAEYEDYPVSFWAVVDKEGDTPEIIRMSRRGFLTGEVKLGELTCDIVLSDGNNDGVFAAGDWWELRTRGSDKPGTMRAVGDYTWAGGKAWTIELTGTNGRQVKVASIDPGCTEEEDNNRRDKLREDRLAKRAEKPVLFRKDVDVAIKEAADKKLPLFIKFETDWCGPCKEMTSLVFTAKDVAEAVGATICVVVDGDKRKDLTEMHKVKAYPTGVMIDGEGKEVTRYVGYQSVKQTRAFLKKAQ